MGIIAVIITFVCICVDNLVSANMSALKLTKENKSIFSVKIALFFTAANVILFTLGYLVSIFFFHNWVYFAHNWVAFAFFLLLGIKLMLESIEKSPSFGDADAGDLWKLIKVSTIIGLNGFLVGYALESTFKSWTATFSHCRDTRFTQRLASASFTARKNISKKCHPTKPAAI